MQVIYLRSRALQNLTPDVIPSHQNLICWTRHLHTLCDCLPIPSESPSVLQLLSHTAIICIAPTQ